LSTTSDQGGLPLIKRFNRLPAAVPDKPSLIAQDSKRLYCVIGELLVA
jgi:hypothetical protein